MKPRASEIGAKNICARQRARRAPCRPFAACRGNVFLVKPAGMDSETFIRWALDDARTVEERYTTELLVEQGVSWWNSRHQIYKHEGYEARRESQRQRALNPAYEPRYSEESLRKTSEMLPGMKSWSCFCGYEERPVRDLKVLAFLTNLENLQIHHVEVTDVSVLPRLPRLSILRFCAPNATICVRSPAAPSCVELVLGWSMHGTGEHWPDVTGLEQLTQLEILSLTGNLLAFSAASPGRRCGVPRSNASRCPPAVCAICRSCPPANF